MASTSACMRMCASSSDAIQTLNISTRKFDKSITIVATIVQMVCETGTKGKPKSTQATSVMTHSSELRANADMYGLPPPSKRWRPEPKRMAESHISEYVVQAISLVYS